MFQGNGIIKYTVIFIRFSCETFNKPELSHLHLFGRTSVSHLNIITSSMKEFHRTTKFLVKQGGKRRNYCVRFFSANANFQNYIYE